MEKRERERFLIGGVQVSSVDDLQASHRISPPRCTAIAQQMLYEVKKTPQGFINTMDLLSTRIIITLITAKHDIHATKLITPAPWSRSKTPPQAQRDLTPLVQPSSETVEREEGSPLASPPNSPRWDEIFSLSFCLPMLYVKVSNLHVYLKYSPVTFWFFQHRKSNGLPFEQVGCILMKKMLPLRSWLAHILGRRVD